MDEATELGYVVLRLPRAIQPINQVAKLLDIQSALLLLLLPTLHLLQLLLLAGEGAITLQLLIEILQQLLLQLVLVWLRLVDAWADLLQ